ncbi:MAG: LLM class flavin-dependent oxidoreductase [Xanthobacteraceae bacterium]
MQFGIYAPIPMATVGSPEAARAVTEALQPLPPGRVDAQFDHSVELLQAADDVGFDLILFAERHLGYDLSAWLLASAVGSRLNRIRSLVAVHPGLWDPVMVGKLAVSLDRMCKGRMALNIVNGWFDEEFRMFGGTVLKGEDRYRRTVEFIDVLRGLWTNDTFSYDGQFYKVDKGQLLLKPASPTAPEIYSVSRSDRGRDFIAQNCDWWFVDMPKDVETIDDTIRGIEDNIADMDRRSKATGRKVRYALNPFVALGRNQQEALDATVKQIFDHDPVPDTRKIESRMLPATKAGLIGSPDAVLRQLRRYESLGIELVLCKMIPTVENIRHVAAEIVAPMRGNGASLPIAS